jgi:hypothetical protein
MQRHSVHEKFAVEPKKTASALDMAEAQGEFLRLGIDQNDRGSHVLQARRDETGPD